jgi:hypothetical protein
MQGPSVFTPWLVGQAGRGNMKKMDLEVDRDVIGKKNSSLQPPLAH